MAVVSHLKSVRLATLAEKVQRSSLVWPLAIAVISFLLMAGAIIWLGNVHFGTMNGLWKSTLVEDWERTPSTARLDPSNYLYYPTIALLCQFLDLIGVYVGMAWKQIAVVNAAFAALNLGVLFHFIRRFTGRGDAALAAVLLAAGCGFFLQLGTSNEDIMPTFTLVFIAMVLAASWFSAPSAYKVAVVGVIFTLGWLGEWRLIFPTLPALLAALAFSSGSLRRRAFLILILLLATVATALLVANRWEGHYGATGLPGLLWTGKGIATGWAGFSWEKAELLAVGIGEYLLGGRQVATPAEVRALVFEWLSALVLEATFLGVVLAWAWRHRNDIRIRVAAIIFGAPWPPDR